MRNIYNGKVPSHQANDRGAQFSGISNNIETLSLSLSLSLSLIADTKCSENREMQLGG